MWKGTTTGLLSCNRMTFRFCAAKVRLLFGLTKFFPDNLCYIFANAWLSRIPPLRISVGITFVKLLSDSVICRDN